jgi:hypothetical protein
MHVAVFFLVNLVVAAAMGVMAYVNGHGAGGIAWRVIATLVAMQAAYALWIAAVAWLAPPSEDETAKTEPRTEAEPRPSKIAARSRDQVR